MDIPKILFPATPGNDINFHGDNFINSRESYTIYKDSILNKFIGIE